MKNLYILISDGGDGSYSLSYTMDGEMIARMQEAYDNDELDEWVPGVDGDGFNYQTLTIPDECTYKSLGIFGNGYVWEPGYA
jgi:hypothetical protein